MRWKIKPLPEIGDKRKVKRFAWFPTICGDDVIWLETYHEMQAFLMRPRGTKAGIITFAAWDTYRFELKEKKK